MKAARRITRRRGRKARRGGVLGLDPGGNYRAKLEALGPQAPGLHRATIAHDDWCSTRRSGGRCNCDPHVSVAPIGAEEASEGWRVHQLEGTPRYGVLVEDMAGRPALVSDNLLDDPALPGLLAQGHSVPVQTILADFSALTFVVLRGTEMLARLRSAERIPMGKA